MLLDHITKIMARGSKSFNNATKLFDPATRRSVLMLYAWCRHCDDVIDGQTLGFRSAQSWSEDPKQRLKGLLSQTRQAYAGLPMSHPAFAAFQRVALQHQIPPQLAFDHLKGFEMDVSDTQYTTFDDTLRYCYHVAGVVGLMMAQIMGVKEAGVLDRACDLGLAFQLTNIARDLLEDAFHKRCYMPTSWLAKEGLDRHSLTKPIHRPALARLAAQLIDTAEFYYASARAGIAMLPLRSAWAVATAHGVYRQIGIKVRDAGVCAWQARQQTSRAEKIWFVLSGAFYALSTCYTRAQSRPPDLWRRPHQHDADDFY